jgi:ABC-2 type transport system permease protein
MIEAFTNVCWAEALKLRRSRAPLMTALAYAMVPPATALLMLVWGGSPPASTYRFSTLQSQIILVQADWPRYFDMLAACSAVGGLIVFSLFIIWIFGREHADHTSKELLTLPVPREAFVAAKLLTAGAWCLAIQGGMLLAALLIGACLGLPGGTAESLRAGLVQCLCVSAMSFCLAIPFGLVANLSRGIMAAVGLLFLTLFFGVVLVCLGWGAYFPWAIPALSSGAAGLRSIDLGVLQLSLVALAGLAGTLGSMLWWRWADQH